AIFTSSSWDADMTCAKDDPGMARYIRQARQADSASL
ncbi:unnamed protein product, partial [marine sediment metagenome]